MAKYCGKYGDYIAIRFTDIKENPEEIKKIKIGNYYFLIPALGGNRVVLWKEIAN